MENNKLVLVLFGVLIVSGLAALLIGDNLGGNWITGAFSVNEFSINSWGNGTDCGVINQTTTLTRNVNSTGTCFHFNASNVVLDCDNYWINYSISASGYGINITGYNNITVKNCEVQEGPNGGSDAIYIIDAKEIEIDNVTVRTTQVSSNPIYVDSASNNTIIRNSNFTAENWYAMNIIGRNVNVTNNTAIMRSRDGQSVIYATGFFGYYLGNHLEGHALGSIGFDVNEHNQTFINNSVWMNGSQSFAAKITGYNNTYWRNNSLYSLGAANAGVTSRAFMLTGNSGDNTLENNYLYANSTTSFEIWDETNANMVNYLQFNNSLFQVQWIHNGSGSFPENLTIEGFFHLDEHVLLHNQTVAFNLSNISYGKLNNSIKIRMLKAATVVTEVFLDQNFTNYSNQIISQGKSCLGNNCTFIGFGLNKYEFNSSHLGSFFVNLSADFTNTAPTLDLLLVNATRYFNHTDDTLYCYVNATDTENTFLEAFWTWYNGSSSYSTGSTELNNGTLTQVASLDPAVTLRDDNWTCQVVVGDGNLNASPSNKSIKIADFTCGDKITESTTLKNDITGCTNTGLNITNNHTTLNCNSSIISGNGTFGIYARFVKNITLHDCSVSNFKNGTYFLNVTDGLVNRSIFNNNTENFNLYNGSNFTFTYNNFTNATTWNLNVWDGRSITVKENRFTDSTGNGVYFVRVNRGVIHNNTFTRLNHTEVIVNLDDSVENFTGNITYNNISNNFNSTGIYPRSHRGNDYRYYGNYIFNNSIGYDMKGFLFGNITHEKIISNTKAISIFGTMQDAIVYHTNFTKNDFDIHSDSGPNYGNVTFINTTANRSLFSLSATQYAYLKSLIHVNVTDSSNNSIVNATVYAYDVTGTLRTYANTSNGGTVNLEVLTMYHNNRINYLISPTIFRVIKNNFTRNLTIVNYLQIREDLLNLTIDEFSCGSSLASDLEMGSNFGCGGAGLHFSGNGSTLFGKDYDIKGDSTGDGINTSNSSYMNVQNLRLINFTRSLYLQNTTHSRLINVTIINATTGVVFNNSDNNSIYDSYFQNITGFAVVAANDGTTNNSIVNTSLDPSNVSVSGTASVYLRWYVDVNVTLNSGIALPNAIVNGFFNSTNDSDDNGVTGNDGIVRLELAEWKKNSSGVNYLTPHNISVYFTYLNVNISNSTTINLTKTNSTTVQLNLGLNCTGPSSDLAITDDITLCPGTYTAENISVEGHNLTVQCENTVIRLPSGGTKNGLNIINKQNISVKNCGWEDFDIAVYIKDSRNITIDSHFSPTGYLDCTDSTENRIENSTFEIGSFSNCNKSTITKNVFGHPDKFYAANVISVGHSIFDNNTFNGTYAAISITNEPAHTNTSFYYNTFKDIGGLWVDFGDFLPNSDYNWNTSVGGNPQGNNWDLYCDKGTDSDGDGYADAVSSGVDWPFNSTTTTLFRPGESITDYGPVQQDCVTEIDLGTGDVTTSGASSAASTSGGSAAPSTPSAGEAAAAAISAPSSTGGSAYVKDNLKTAVAGLIENPDGSKTVKVSFTNTGNQEMKLDPDVDHSPKDQFLVKARSVPTPDVFLAKLSNDAPDTEPYTAALKEESKKQVVIPPGETIQTEFNVKSFLSAKPAKVDLIISSFGEKVKEEGIEFEKRSPIGASFVQEENDWTVYTVFYPEVKTAKSSKDKTNSNTLTGAASADLKNGGNQYYIEFSILTKEKYPFFDGDLPAIMSNFKGIWDKVKFRKTLYSDLYGPFDVPPEGGHVLAQTLDVDQTRLAGRAAVVQTKLTLNGKVVAENEFDVKNAGKAVAGEVKELKLDDFIWVILSVLIFIVSLLTFFGIKHIYDAG